MPQTVFGQSDAVAREVAAALNGMSGAFCLPVAAEVRYARKMDIKDIGGIDEAGTFPDPVNIQVIPVADQTDRTGLGGQYDDTYGVHVLLQQHVGSAAESHVPLLLQLRSEVLELLMGGLLTAAAAVHPFVNASVGTVRQPQGERLYDLDRLESLNAFYSDTILTYKAAGLRRNNG
jgi:hypothetical protein